MFYLATDSDVKFQDLLSSNATIIKKDTEQVRDFDTGWISSAQTYSRALTQTSVAGRV